MLSLHYLQASTKALKIFFMSSLSYIFLAKVVFLWL